MKTKAFFFDIDGTLLPIGKNNVLNSTRYAIKQLVKNGHEVYIATGKSYADASWVGEILNIDSYLTSNGQVIYKDGKIIAEEYFTKEMLDAVTKQAKENNITVGYQGNDSNLIIPGKGYEDLLGFFKNVNIPIPQSIEEVDYDFATTQAWVAGDFVDLDFGQDIRVVKWPSAGADLVYTHASKGRAISKHFDHEKYETYAFGDGENDIEMFKHCDHAIVMENATDSVKKHAKYVTDDCESDGIYNYLVKHNLIEPMTPQKIAFLDIDGTLLVTGETKLRQEVIDGVKKMKENGCIPVICTGRGYEEAKAFIDILELDSYITSNGQEVVFKGNTVALEYLKEEVIEDLKNIAESNDICWAYETRKQIYLVESRDAEVVRDLVHQQGLFKMDISSEHIKDGVFQIWMFGQEEDVDKVQAIIENKYSFYRWEPTAIEVVKEGNNKAKGICKLLNYYDGYAMTYGFGDGHNDLEMMDIVDISVAMGNSIDELKEIADYTTKTSEELGLVEAFKKLNLV